jgi:hypothetical protein
MELPASPVCRYTACVDCNELINRTPGDVISWGNGHITILGLDATK